jgi:uncharacterized protein (DUF58 family)
MVPSRAMLWIVGGIGAPLSVAAAVAGWPVWPFIAALAMAAGVDAILSRRMLAGLRAGFTAPVRLFKGREQALAMRLESPCGEGRRLRVGVAFPDGLVAREEETRIQLQEGDAAVEIAWRVTALRRGQFLIPSVAVETASKLGLWDVRAAIPVNAEIRAYPNVRVGGALAALRRDRAGLRLVRQVGKGREFEKLREYMPGDGFDEIHWKATARRGQPVTKVFQIERTQEVYVVIDAGRLSARDAAGEPVLDQYLTGALVMGLAAEQRGDLFGLVTFSDRIHGFVRARNGKAHYAACRDAIYRLEPQPVAADFDELAAFLRTRLRRRALVVVLASLDDPVVADSFLRSARLIAQRHLVTAVMIRPRRAAPLFTEPAESVEEVAENLAGHLSWHSLKQLESAARRSGVHLHLAEAATFHQELVGLYDEVKQRQLL